MKEPKQKGIGRGNNPNSKKNLKPNYNGETKNPFGRPKGSRDRATGLKIWLAQTIKWKNEAGEDEEGNRQKIFDELPEELKITVEDAIDFALIAEAKDGNLNAIREIKDTLYGKVPDKLQITVAPEIEAAQGLYQSLVESGLSPNQAVKKVIEGAKASGFDLTKDDILDANTIG